MEQLASFQERLRQPSLRGVGGAEEMIATAL
jgi:hypothetical protein